MRNQFVSATVTQCAIFLYQKAHRYSQLAQTCILFYSEIFEHQFLWKILKNALFHNSSTRFLGRRFSWKCSTTLRNQDFPKSVFTISRGDFSFVKSSKMQKRESCQGESTSDPFLSHHVYFHLQWGNQFQKKAWPLKG